MIGKILGFVQTHWISLGCGVAALVFVMLAVMGMGSKAVVKQMEAEVARLGAGSIQSLMGSAKNPDLIQKEKDRGAAFKKEFEEVRTLVRDINKREPLMSGVFPNPKDDQTRLQFAEEYSRQVDALATRLEAGTLPSEDEILEEKQNVEDLVAQETEAEEELKTGSDPTKPTRTTRQPPVARTNPQRPGVRRTGEGGGEGGRFSATYRGPTGEGGGEEVGLRGRSSGASSVNLPMPGAGAEPKYNWVFRAQVAKANSILCYYDPTTFSRSPIATQLSAPLGEDMWFAQVGLWIQQDLADAIAKLNRESGERVTDADPYVENSPIKHIVSVQVLGYSMPQGKDIPFPSLSTGQGTVSTGSYAGSGKPAGTLTNRTSNELYDVVRFNVTLVVDQREMLRVMDAVSRANFYQILSARFEAVERAAREREGYLYGTSPIVQLTLECEGYLMREVYVDMMPDTVKKLLGIEVKPNP